jgi:hypothetical protein
MTMQDIDFDAAFQRAAELKERMEQELLKKANVVGVGVGLRQREGQLTGEVALIVMVQKKISNSQLAPEDRIPAEINNVPVDVLEVGHLRVNDGEVSSG